MIYQVHQQDAELRGEERGEQKEKINNAKGMPNFASLKNAAASTVFALFSSG